MSDVKETEKLTGRRRRNSDSFLCSKPNKDDVTLVKLTQAENRWNYEREIRQTIEEENKILKPRLQRQELYRDKSGVRIVQDSRL